jgi:hypothetical protein
MNDLSAFVLNELIELADDEGKELFIRTDTRYGGKSLHIQIGEDPPLVSYCLVSYPCKIDGPALLRAYVGISSYIRAKNLCSTTTNEKAQST